MILGPFGKLLDRPVKIRPLFQMKEKNTILNFNISKILAEIAKFHLEDTQEIKEGNPANYFDIIPSVFLNFQIIFRFYLKPHLN